MSSSWGAYFSIDGFYTLDPYPGQCRTPCGSSVSCRVPRPTASTRRSFASAVAAPGLAAQARRISTCCLSAGGAPALARGGRRRADRCRGAGGARARRRGATRGGRDRTLSRDAHAACRRRSRRLSRAHAASRSGARTCDDADRGSGARRGADRDHHDRRFSARGRRGRRRRRAARPGGARLDVPPSAHRARDPEPRWHRQRDVPAAGLRARRRGRVRYRSRQHAGGCARATPHARPPVVRRRRPARRARAGRRRRCCERGCAIRISGAGRRSRRDASSSVRPTSTR